MEKHQKETFMRDSSSLNFHGQSNSNFLKQGNAKATQIFGKKIFLPSAPMLRLLGKSMPVLENYGNTSMATKDSDKKKISNRPSGSSQNHVNWFHPAPHFWLWIGIKGKHL